MAMVGFTCVSSRKAIHKKKDSESICTLFLKIKKKLINQMSINRVAIAGSNKTRTVSQILYVDSHHRMLLIIAEQLFWTGFRRLHYSLVPAYIFQILKKFQTQKDI